MTYNMAEMRRIAPVNKILTHTRFLLTLRSAEGIYKSLLLFRLSNGNQGQIADGRNADEIYVMESACPHLGADMSHADIEDGEDGVVAVCPWHRFVHLRSLIQSTTQACNTVFSVPDTTST